MTVTFPSITIDRVTEVLKRHNAMFCKVSDLPGIIQKESDRTQVLSMHMRMVES